MRHRRAVFFAAGLAVATAIVSYLVYDWWNGPFLYRPICFHNHEGLIVLRGELAPPFDEAPDEGSTWRELGADGKIYVKRGFRTVHEFPDEVIWNFTSRDVRWFLGKYPDESRQRFVEWQRVLGENSYASMNLAWQIEQGHLDDSASTCSIMMAIMIKPGTEPQDSVAVK